MSRYVLTAAARDDIEEIEEFLAQHSVDAPIRVLANLRKAMRQIAEMPGIGHVRNDLADEELRFYLVHSYLIVYRPEAKPLQILRVLHGARDIGTILAEG